ncbi:MAG: hypothetical protein ROZ64_16155 [Burkholderiaceae bacterium]|nr:hypothetical protein [Burkholderiaceae bacterium]
MSGREELERSVVLFPGWFIEQGPGSTRELWVLNPRALPAFLKHEQDVLADSDVAMAAYHLSRFVRAKEREKA